MAATLKTTVYLDPDDYRQLKLIARSQRRPPAAVIRAAVAEYSARHAIAKRPKSLGAFRSGRKDLGSKAEDLLVGMGRPRGHR